MKRILVMCKDREQWVEFQEILSWLRRGSLTTRIELRADSVILNDFEGDTTFLMFTPNTSEDIAKMFLFDNIKWLCDESLFDKEIVDYLKGRIGE
jgi:hypothetical protein